MPTDFDIFRAITSTWCLNVRCLSKIIPKNLIILVSSIVADTILILVKCNSFLYEKIIYFVLSTLIQIFKHHVDVIARKISKYVGILFKLSKYLPTEIIKNVILHYIEHKRASTGVPEHKRASTEVPEHKRASTAVPEHKRASTAVPEHISTAVPEQISAIVQQCQNTLAQ